MKYKLIGDNEIFNIKKTIFNNRGVEDIQKFCNPTEDNLWSWKLLDRIDDGVELLHKHMLRQGRVHIIVDCDPDGFTSASMMYRYLVFGLKHPESLVTWHVHPRKEHGIILSELEDFSFDLLIVPDAGSNNYEQHEYFRNKGVDILILDHHECEKVSEHAIVINPQLDNYPNKNLSGSMVTYKFCQALDSFYSLNIADNYLDLAVVGGISDMMLNTDYENRYMFQTGLANIKNKFLKALVEKQSYSIGDGGLSYFSIAFYITPLLNAMIRVGELKDKQNLFRAFIEDDAVIGYIARGKKEEEIVPLYQDMCRQCVNAKAKQDRSKEKIVDTAMDGTNVIYDGAILILESQDSNLKGLVANAIANTAMKPTLILFREGSKVYTGSGRGVERHAITDLRQLCLDSGCFTLAEGHANAFGIIIPVENIPKLVAFIEETCYNVDTELEYLVDFVFKGSQISESMFKEFDSIKSMYGQGFKEPMVAIENVEFECPYMTDKVFSFEYKGVKYTKFRPKEREIGLENKTGILSIVGRCGFNEYKGQKTPQVIITDYEVKEIKEVGAKAKFSF